MRTRLCGVVALLSLLIVTGCSTLDSLYVQRPASTNAVTGEVTPATVEPNPIVDVAINGIGGLPFPWSGPIALALGWAYSAYSSARNRKLAVVGVEGVELVRKIIQETPEGKVIDGKIRDALVRHQNFRGVLAEISKLVKAYTK